VSQKKKKKKKKKKKTNKEPVIPATQEAESRRIRV
jgi:hypothetical protein